MTSRFPRTIPSLHGSPKAFLIDGRLKASRAVAKAMAALSEIKPHGRDYVGRPDALRQDLDIYKDRFLSLDSLYSSLLDEAQWIDENFDR